MLMIRRPTPAASAMAEPDMPAKITLCTTFTWPRPPLKRPTTALQKCSRRFDRLPTFISSADMMNSGMASSTKLPRNPCSSCSAAMLMSCPATSR